MIGASFRRLRLVLGDIHRSGWFGYMFVGVMFLTIGLSLNALVFRSTSQPLLITACTPESYTAPAQIDQTFAEQGPLQTECTRVFAARGDQWLSSEPALVHGQVCNLGDVPVAYRIEVALESVQAGRARVLILDVPITYDPGCQLPYEFPFSVPPTMVALSDPGDSLGEWRIVGRAIPVNRAAYEPYQWDATATAEIIHSVPAD